MTYSYDNDQLVPSISSTTGMSSTRAEHVVTERLSPSFESDSDSLGSQSNSSTESASDSLCSLGRRTRTGTPADTRATVSAMRRLAARIVRKASRSGRGKLSADRMVRQLMKRDIERRDRYISELRQGNRVLEKQMREAEAEFDKLFETCITNLIVPCVYIVDDDVE